MNLDTITTDPKAITELAAAIIAARDTEANGRATYLRCLLAGTQTELAGAPVIRSRRGAPPDAAKALETLERVNTTYYEAVLKAVPASMSAAEKNAATGFARSAASTLRRAIRLGWNPLTALGQVTKYALLKWSDEHAAPRTPSVNAVQKRVDRYLARIGELVSQLSAGDAQLVLEHVRTELEAELPALAPPEPQRITRAALRRSEARPH